MTTTSQRRPPTRSAATSPVAGRRRDVRSRVAELQRRWAPWGARLDSPVTSYYVLIGATAALVLIGLVMVLSASMVTALKAEGSSYAVFTNQAVFAVVGLVGAIVAAKIPVRLWKRLALPALVGAVALQAAVFTPLGAVVNGNRNWLRIFGMSMQPSELTKLGLVLVGALILSNRRHQLGSLKAAIIPYLVPIVALTVGLVLAGHDLGTALILIIVVGVVLYVAGVSARLFALAGAVAAAVVAGLVLTSPNRVGRITNWLSGDCTDPNGVCGQSVHGLYALADGGWWGVGLGASKEKWAWLPEAHNDFIFAIIGEELGLPGTLVILGLFLVFATACLRIVLRSDDHFVRVATAGAMAWILGQAMVNIGAVIGLLPVIGVPLPFVSAGGSALISSMLAVGMLVSFARHEPGAQDILSARPGVVKRSLAVLPGRRAR
ncbi:MAG: putative lipid II flippase FtsW [Actinomycetales bacterium]|jgi:cell division protein FtsW|nr:putative lipid II flippase FtsW [Actinomycetales bacterium]